jgi:ABC-type amino acid transport substrate-binding protein
VLSLTGCASNALSAPRPKATGSVSVDSAAPGTTVHPHNSAATNAAVLCKAAAVSADSRVTLYVIEKSKGKRVIVGKAFDSAPYEIVLAKDSGLAPAILAALQSLMDDGTYGEILSA